MYISSDKYFGTVFKVNSSYPLSENGKPLAGQDGGLPGLHKRGPGPLARGGVVNRKYPVSQVYRE